jgi:predicted transcriptional regulator
MKRSKIEKYFDILKCLASSSPLRITHLMYKANINCKVLKNCLAFLIDKDLVEKVACDGKVSFRITDEGKIVLMHFVELQEALMPEEYAKTSVF